MSNRFRVDLTWHDVPAECTDDYDWMSENIREGMMVLTNHGNIMVVGSVNEKGQGGGCGCCAENESIAAYTTGLADILDHMNSPTYSRPHKSEQEVPE